MNQFAEMESQSLTTMPVVAPFFAQNLAQVKASAEAGTTTFMSLNADMVVTCALVEMRL